MSTGILFNWNMVYFSIVIYKKGAVAVFCNFNVFLHIIFRPFITTIRTNIGCAIKIGVVHVALRTVGNFTHNSNFKMSGKDRDITSYLNGSFKI